MSDEAKEKKNLIDLAKGMGKDLPEDMSVEEMRETITQMKKDNAGAGEGEGDSPNPLEAEKAVKKAAKKAKPPYWKTRGLLKNKKK